MWGRSPELPVDFVVTKDGEVGPASASQPAMKGPNVRSAVVPTPSGRG